MSAPAGRGVRGAVGERGTYPNPKAGIWGARRGAGRGSCCDRRDEGAVLICLAVILEAWRLWNAKART